MLEENIGAGGMKQFMNNPMQYGNSCEAVHREQSNFGLLQMGFGPIGAPMSRNSSIDCKIVELAQVIGQTVEEKLRAAYTNEIVDPNFSLWDQLQHLDHRIKVLESQTNRKPEDNLEMKSVPSSLNDRLSTIEGRQRSIQRQMSQLFRVLNISNVKEASPLINVRDENRMTQLETKMDLLNDEVVNGKRMVSMEKHIQELVTLGTHLQKQTRYLEDTFGKLSQQVEIIEKERHDTLTECFVQGLIAEKIDNESRNRLRGEVRTYRKLEEFEDCLQELESELSSWHTSSSTQLSQQKNLATRLSYLESNLGKTKEDVDKLRKKVVQVGNSVPDRDATMKALQQCQVQFKLFQNQTKQISQEGKDADALRENDMKRVSDSVEDLSNQIVKLKNLVGKQMRSQQSAEQMLQEYVGTITHQVASVTRQYVSVRIQDNNRLLDATLRARIPDYVQNESESFMLVRPEADRISGSLPQGVVLPDNDSTQDILRKVLNPGNPK